ncbi:hypothetical protein AWB69_07236 [Caballeronia udeis]|uniref:Uncharacterized protein n=1 Tax=Caballeronia udeis TaxID=1232866 RepID=A0A158J631_9BURK|nr:hypothetical protein [Caballeronia udeis]SAL64298.1 hypothetical protein AWB69_07236 [Caballeronia udeis]
MLVGASIFNVGRKNQELNYSVDVAQGDGAEQYVYDFVEVDGLRFPTKRRAYLGADDLQLRRDHLMVSIDLNDFRLAKARFR